MGVLVEIQHALISRCELWGVVLHQLLAADELARVAPAKAEARSRGRRRAARRAPTRKATDRRGRRSGEAENPFSGERPATLASRAPPRPKGHPAVAEGRVKPTARLRTGVVDIHDIAFFRSRRAALRPLSPCPGSLRHFDHQKLRRAGRNF